MESGLVSLFVFRTNNMKCFFSARPTLIKRYVLTHTDSVVINKICLIISNVTQVKASSVIGLLHAMSVNTGDDMEHMEQIRHHNCPRNTCKTAMNQLKYV